MSVLNYIIHKRIETFSFRDVSNTRDIRIYFLKCFQVYILVHLYQNQKRKTFELFTKIFELYQVSQIF